MRIYTKTGDKGETSLYGGKRVKKDHKRIETYGSVDELNSVIGVVIAEIISQNSKVKSQNYNSKVKSLEQLVDIQKDLLLIGSLLSGYILLEVNNLILNTKKLEDWIDAMDKDLPELKNFILPGGSKTASLLHLARSICRRAERRVVGLRESDHTQQDILIYLNRLSDYFFVLARYFNFQNNIKEEIWQIDRDEK